MNYLITTSSVIETPFNNVSLSIEYVIRLHGTKKTEIIKVRQNMFLSFRLSVSLCHSGGPLLVFSRQLVGLLVNNPILLDISFY